MWNVECGLWIVECGLWNVECGMWIVECGLWNVDCGMWIVGWATLHQPNTQCQTNQHYLLNQFIKNIGQSNNVGLVKRSPTYEI